MRARDGRAGSVGRTRLRGRCRGSRKTVERTAAPHAQPSVQPPTADRDRERKLARLRRHRNLGPRLYPMIKPLGAISGDRRQAPSPDVSTSLLPHDAALSRRARRAAILGRIGLDLSPRDQPDMACSRVGDRHRRAGRGLHRRRSAWARTTVKLSRTTATLGGFPTFAGTRSDDKVAP